jgi:hypothetical protein
MGGDGERRIGTRLFARDLALGMAHSYAIEVDGDENVLVLTGHGLRVLYGATEPDEIITGSRGDRHAVNRDIC